MAIVRWSPAREIAALQNQMDRLFGNYTNWPERQQFDSGLFPAVDVIETQDAYILRADLPGMKLEDIKVHLANNVLTIKGEKRYQHEERNANFLHSERTYGSFERSFTLGTPIQADAIKARYTDGVLEVQLLKSEQQKLKEIKIEQ
jgi:HSP20 family protein